MIELNQVTKKYGAQFAVNALDLQIGDGEIVGIIGHNGAGKSTTLKMIAGLLTPTSGMVRVMGYDMSKDSTAAKRWIGYLPEESPLYENMTAREYLLFFAELYGLTKMHARVRIDELLNSLNLREQEKLTGEFSKGMKRKVAIARALLHDPRLLILDEPNSGLDPLTSFFILNYLKTLKGEGKTIVLSAHNLFHVESICDRVAIIKSGRMIVCDNMEAIRASLGNREFHVVFRAEASLDQECRDYERKDGSYVFRTNDVGAMSAMLAKISENKWTMVDLSVQESALEEIYVKLMTN
ncbi:MAG: ABC transporter ATP-binding protein [Chloroflexi bacterium]|nr:ABC transporter ATP-binding protein [Chloroflexota bacterium]